MKCPACQAEVPDDMTLCGYCGASLKKAGAPPPPVMAPPPVPPATTTEEMQKILWTGRFSGRAMARYWLLYFVIAAALFVGWHYLPEPYSTQDWPKYVLGGILAGMPLLILLSLLVRKISIKYWIAGDRLFVSQGVLLNRQDETWLARIDDLRVEQTLLNRIFGVGRVIVVARSDETTPVIALEGIAKPYEVKELIWKLVRRMKERSLRIENI